MAGADQSLGLPSGSVQKNNDTWEEMMTLPDMLTSCLMMRCMEIWSGNHQVSSATSTPGLDIFVTSQPYQNAQGGGDVHYVSLCGGGQTTRIILADLAGHGNSASSAALRLRQLMRDHINSKTHDRMLRTLNQQFLKQTNTSRFATAVLATFLARRHVLTLSNAGHPRPLWWSIKSESWDFVSQDDQNPQPLSDLPLGIDEETNYGSIDMMLAPGDLLVFYSDALIETSNPEGVQLGERGLKRILECSRGIPPGELGRTVLNELEAFRSGEPAGDDETIIVIHHNGIKSRRKSLREKWDVYCKYFHLRGV
jgi:serine phosphatase RsbU (regulator of sigma subunit)